MIPELILSGGLAITGGLSGFLLRDLFGPGRKPSGRPSPERGDSREEIFRDSLIQALKSPPMGGVHLEAMSDACGVAPGRAVQIAEVLYGRFARKVADDGIITTEERHKLDGLALALGIEPHRATHIESKANDKIYREVVMSVLEDGVVTTEEADYLAKLRKSLGIARGVAGAIMAGEAKKTTDQPDPHHRRLVQDPVVGGMVAGLTLSLVIILGTYRSSHTVLTIAPDSPASAAPGAIEEAVASPERVSDPVPVHPGQGALTADSSPSPPPTARPARASNPQPIAPSYSYDPSPSYSPSPSQSSNGRVYVRSYTRKDGTHVQAHTRSSPRRK